MKNIYIYMAPSINIALPKVLMDINSFMYNNMDMVPYVNKYVKRASDVVLNIFGTATPSLLDVCNHRQDIRSVSLIKFNTDKDDMVTELNAIKQSDYVIIVIPANAVYEHLTILGLTIGLGKKIYIIGDVGKLKHQTMFSMCDDLTIFDTVEECLGEIRNNIDSRRSNG